MDQPRAATDGAAEPAERQAIESPAARASEPPRAAAPIAALTQALEDLARLPASPAPAALGAPRSLDIPERGRPLAEAAAELVREILPRAARSDHPRFFAFIPSPAGAASRLGEALTAAVNPQAGAWRQAEGPAAVEAAVIRWMADRAGFPDTAGGLFMGGGSAANLTAVAAAREAKLQPEKRADGVAYLSAETHSSVLRALAVAGFLPGQIRRVALDAAFRMDASDLARLVAADLAAGRRPFLVVATAGATNTGAVDPLDEIAALCERSDLWLHVDGAFGASALLSPAHRPLLAGIERADSLAWDAHKWLFQTYGCGALIVRDEARLEQAFSLGADYLRDGDLPGSAPNFWDLGLETSRPARALKLWLTLQTMGTAAIGAAVAHGFRLAAWAEDELTRTPGWRVVTAASMAIVTFRFEPSRLSPEQTDALNLEAARRLERDGFALVGATRVQGRVALRICALHPDATEGDMRETIRRLDAEARAAPRELPL